MCGRWEKQKLSIEPMYGWATTAERNRMHQEISPVTGFEA